MDEKGFVFILRTDIIHPYTVYGKYSLKLG